MLEDTSTPQIALHIRPWVLIMPALFFRKVRVESASRILMYFSQMVSGMEANPSDIGNEDGDGNSDFDGGPHGDLVSQH